MIHQHIFACPKPGMSEEEFQRYWVHEHAVKYAGKIPQIRRYMVCTRVAADNPHRQLPFSGVAEIWLDNEKEQLESLQTPEFLQGARLDEPRWAAFWATLVLDTDAHVLMEGPPLTPDPTWTKLYLLLKRKPGMPLDEFRQYALQSHAPKVLALPGLRRYLQCHVRDSYYALGESRFDAIAQLWFDDTQALQQALDSPCYHDSVAPNWTLFTDPKYLLTLAATEHWIIGPEARPYSPSPDSEQLVLAH
jgi:uncharacterized protein (TIGR02118 family)